MNISSHKQAKASVCDCLDFQPDLFIVVHICNTAFLEKISTRKVITSLQTFSYTSDKKRLINDLY